jgi:Na+/proline symporter
MHKTILLVGAIVLVLLLIVYYQRKTAEHAQPVPNKLLSSLYSQPEAMLPQSTKAAIPGWIVKSE